MVSSLTLVKPRAAGPRRKSGCAVHRSLFRGRRRACTAPVEASRKLQGRALPRRSDGYGEQVLATRCRAALCRAETTDPEERRNASTCKAVALACAAQAVTETPAR